MFTGIILTNTHRLASVLCTTRNEVIEAISSYISACASYIRWEVIDMSDELYTSLDKSDWQTYSTTLNEYYIGLGLDGKNYCPLFILGGDDVVPMPKINNPIKMSREFLDSDMAYCFDGTTVRDNLNDYVSLKPRFAVGRLPLCREWGLGGLVSYLNDCVEFAATGIPIRGAAMTTTQSWLRASDEMMKGIHTVSLSEEYVPLNNRMIVSPDLDTEYKEWYDGYVHELKKIDFLVCNLHGHSNKDIPFFLGEDKEHNYFMAIQPSMLSKTTPYIFNTVACYGARYNPVVYIDGSYTDYDIEESMLMMALANGTMLYCGSCEIAKGGIDGMAGRSELMMKLYNIYLHKGIPAGMALIKAKQDYYRTCSHEEGMDAMFTILEFNLFGCPILSMQPKIDLEYKPTLLGNPIDEHSHAQYQPKTIEVILGGAHKANDIYAYVRGLVDRNLSIIQQKVETEVYQRLGLGKNNLQQVMRVSQDNNILGYQFIYEWSPQQSYRGFCTYYFVDTDTKGGIIKIIQSK